MTDKIQTTPSLYDYLSGYYVGKNKRFKHNLIAALCSEQFIVIPNLTRGQFVSTNLRRMMFHESVHSHDRLNFYCIGGAYLGSDTMRSLYELTYTSGGNIPVNGNKHRIVIRNSEVTAVAPDQLDRILIGKDRFDNVFIHDDAPNDIRTQLKVIEAATRYVGQRYVEQAPYYPVRFDELYSRDVEVEYKIFGGSRTIIHTSDHERIVEAFRNRLPKEDWDKIAVVTG